MELVLPIIQSRKFEAQLASLITHRVTLDEGVRAYDIFHKKAEGCIKVVLQMGGGRSGGDGRAFERDSACARRTRSPGSAPLAVCGTHRAPCCQRAPCAHRSTIERRRTNLLPVGFRLARPRHVAKL